MRYNSEKMHTVINKTVEFIFKYWSGEFFLVHKIGNEPLLLVLILLIASILAVVLCSAFVKLV